MGENEDVSKRGHKVGRVLEKYSLHELEERLPAMWKGEDGESEQGVRELANIINTHIVEQALEESTSTLEDEASSVYEFLTSDSPSQRVAQKQRLEEMGIDPDDLQDDFVAHQTVYKYLTEYLNESKEQKKPSLETSLKRGQNLESRVEVVLNDSISRLDEHDMIRAGDPSVIVDFQVYCPLCNSQFSYSEFLDRGGCDCEE